MFGARQYQNGFVHVRYLSRVRLYVSERSAASITCNGQHTSLRKQSITGTHPVSGRHGGTWRRLLVTQVLRERSRPTEAELSSAGAPFQASERPGSTPGSLR